MKKLGLIGGIGPETTIEYYRSIEYGVQKKSGQNFFPNITIESLNVFDVLNLCKKQDYDGLTDYLLNGINQLSAAGVQYAALTGITTHIVFDALSKVSPVPLVSMVDTASEFAKAHRYRKVCLLGTLPTMNGTFFQQSFESKGIEVITPDAAEKEYIGRKIETELELSIGVIGTPKGWNVSRRYFTPTFYFCDVHVSAVLWVQLLLRDTLLSAVPRCL